MKTIALVFLLCLFFLITPIPSDCGTSGTHALEVDDLELELDFESQILASNNNNDDPCENENICAFNGKTYFVDLSYRLTPNLYSDWFSQCKNDLRGTIGKL
jgi:hypothetical protein